MLLRMKSKKLSVETEMSKTIIFICVGCLGTRKSLVWWVLKTSYFSVIVFLMSYDGIHLCNDLVLKLPLLVFLEYCHLLMAHLHTK